MLHPAEWLRIITYLLNRRSGKYEIECAFKSPNYYKKGPKLTK